MTQEYDLEPVFVFLSSLRANNRKDWFDPHKAEYENARNQFAHLLEAVLAELRDLEELRAVDPRACIQRIYRDIRFSKDKSPTIPAYPPPSRPGTSAPVTCPIISTWSQAGLRSSRAACTPPPPRSWRVSARRLPRMPARSKPLPPRPISTTPSVI